MPIIPLITKSAPVANAPAPVLDRERRPTVDTRGIQAATARITEAGKLSSLPMSLANADGAIGSIGQSIMKTGSVWAAAQEKEEEITERRVITTAQMAMQNVKLEFEAWKEDPANARSPELWAAKAQEMVGSTMAPYLERKELGENARKDLALMGEAWGKGFVNQATLQGRKAGTAILTNDTLSLTEIDYGSGLWGAGDAKIDDLVKVGVMSEDVGKLKKHIGRGQAAAHLLKNAASQAAVLIQAGDPEGAGRVIDAVPPVPGYEQDFENKKAEVKGDLTFVHEVNTEAKQIQDEIARDPRNAQTMMNDPAKYTALRGRDYARFEDLQSKAIAASSERGEREAKAAIEEITGMDPEKAKTATMDSLESKFDYAAPTQRLAASVALAKKKNLLSMDDPGKFNELLATVSTITPSTPFVQIVELKSLIDESFSPVKKQALFDEITNRIEGNLPEGVDIRSIRAPLQQMAVEGAFGDYNVPLKAGGEEMMKKAPTRYTVREEERSWYNPKKWFGDKTVKVAEELPESFEPDTVVDLEVKGKVEAKIAEVEAGIARDIAAGVVTDNKTLEISYRGWCAKVGLQLKPGMNLRLPEFSTSFVPQPKPKTTYDASGNPVPGLPMAPGVTPNPQLFIPTGADAHKQLQDLK